MYVVVVDVKIMSQSRYQIDRARPPQPRPRGRMVVGVKRRCFVLLHVSGVHVELDLISLKILRASRHF